MDEQESILIELDDFELRQGELEIKYEAQFRAAREAKEQRLREQKEKDEKERRAREEAEYIRLRAKFEMGIDTNA